ncbi:MAG: glycosyltransferase family A protein, partial [Pirellulaceae bacterium]|nr:glycosyltransferase family A protein [Pirellulaceae bacterium]
MAEVTIAMNIFNGMPYLPEAVESVCNQSVRDIEIILVNDGSTDGSRDYLERLKDSRIRVFHQENSGTAVASNLAIKHCRTPYIMRMDADDI